MSRPLKLLAALIALALAWLLSQAVGSALNAGWLLLASLSAMGTAMAVTAGVLLVGSMFRRGGAR